VKPEDSLTQLEGAPPPNAGTYLARRAKAALRGNEERQRLSPEETRAQMGFTEDQIAVLDAIAAGLPVRGAREAVAAMRLKADFLLTKPATILDSRVGICVINPYSCEPEDLKNALSASVAVPSLPEGQRESAEDAAPDGEEDNT
jgi:hypothetical protein